MTRSTHKMLEGDYIPHGEAWDDGSASLSRRREEAFSERKQQVMAKIVERMRAEKSAALYDDHDDVALPGSKLSDYA